MNVIACPDCRHRLTLPEEIVVKRVQCPRCGLEFETAEVETPEDAPNASAGPSPKNGSASQDPSGAYTPLDATAAKPAPILACTECGARYRRDAESCPVCGYRTDLMLGVPLERRRPRRRFMQPVSKMLPIVTAILLPAGLVLLLGIPIGHEIFRIRGRAEDLLIGVICLASGSVELAAIVCGCIWLYQAWRAVHRGDDDYPPGLMVGLLFVPFFNLYWIFRAIPGLSTAIQHELNSFGPRRLHGAGYGAGIVGCVFLLIPYFQPVALCIFIAWMLIVNNSLQRLIRYHDDHDADDLRQDESR